MSHTIQMALPAKGRLKLEYTLDGNGTETEQIARAYHECHTELSDEERLLVFDVKLNKAHPIGARKVK